MNEAGVFSLLIEWPCNDLNKVPSTYVSGWRKQAVPSGKLVFPPCILRVSWFASCTFVIDRYIWRCVRRLFTDIARF